MYWEECWKSEDVEELYGYLAKYNKCTMLVMNMYKHVFY